MPAPLAFMDYYKGDDADDFQQAVVDMAGRLGIDPNWIMFVMWNETAHTFKPNIQPTNGPFDPNLATGLIQFEPATAQNLGTSTTALSQMSAIDQLQYVEKYLQDQINTVGPLKSLQDVYLAVFYPAAIAQGSDFQFPDWVVKDNPEFFGDGGNTTQSFINWIKDAIPAKYQSYFAGGIGTAVAIGLGAFLLWKIL